MNKNTLIGLVGGVTLGESLKELMALLIINPLFGASPGAVEWMIVAIVTLLVLTQVTERYSD